MLIKSISDIVPLIDNSCKLLPFPYNDGVRKLILGTAACESLFHIRKQVHGPARGLWQMEPNTAISIYKDFMKYHSDVYKVFVDNFGDPPSFKCPSKDIISNRLVIDDRYACAMARVKYAWDKERIPSNLEDIAIYYKRVYNTFLGKGSAERFLAMWKQLKCDKLLKEAGYA